MKISELMQTWEKNSSGQLTATTYTVRLPAEDAAKIEALSEMYPRRSREDIITDLLTAALSEFESKLPYICGTKVVERDEDDNPLYEDIGPTPRYLQLTKKYLRKYKH